MTHQAEPPTGYSGSELAAGIGVMFAATMMIVGGIFQIFQGLAAVVTDEFFVTLPDYVVRMDVSTWGWIHLVLGALIVIGGFFLFSGSRGAAVFALVLAVASAIRKSTDRSSPSPTWSTCCALPAAPERGPASDRIRASPARSGRYRPRSARRTSPRRPRRSTPRSDPCNRLR